ncbi:cytochrome P450 3A11-like [Littorina saxatilis]|uniref:cytochrome P450 3A11-like n=1 Tax=Littorina saxatilis TaxID=31220 RepID=UPI0038B59B79
MSFFFGLSPTLFVTKLDTVRDILSKHFHAFVNRSGVAALEHRPWDSTLLFLTDDHWRHVRTQLSPTFSTGKLKQVVSTIDHVTKKLENNVQELAAKGETVELKKLCGCFAMDVIAGAAFGVQVDSLVNPDDVFNQRALDLINKNQWVFLCGESMSLYMTFPVVLKFLKLIGITVPQASATQFFVSFLKAALQERRQDNTQHKYKDFLQLLIEAEKEGAEGPVDKEIDHSSQLNTSSQWKQKGLSEDEILGNALSFLFGGYDTVSTVMAYTLFSLAGNPECLRKAQEEVDRVLGENGQLTYEKTNELTYLDMCLSEAMRMYPPGFLLVRKCTEDVEVAGGYHVTKGMDIMIPVVNIHMDPDHWPEPEKFDPERFTPEERAKRHPFAYLPFGQGPRNCIGMRLAQLEIRMAIASLLRRYSPVLCDKSMYPPRLLILSRVDAIDGLWVKFQLRE